MHSWQAVVFEVTLDPKATQRASDPSGNEGVCVKS